ISGQYTTSGAIPDVGVSYSLRATGKLGTLGTTTVTGSLTSLGFVATGRAGGTLTLTNARGSITLRLAGPPQTGVGALPAQFQCSVAEGTGAYKHFQASGTIDLRLRPSGVPFLSPMGNRGSLTDARTGRGTFTLTIHETVTTGIAGVVLEGPIAPV